MSQHQWEFVDGQSTGTRFTWTIGNYSSQYLVTGKKLSSSIFYSGKDYKDQWRLEMYPKGQDESTKDSVPIYLKLMRTSKREINASVKFEMLKPGFNHEPAHNRVYNMYDIIWVQGAREGIIDFAKSSELEAYVKNDTLQLSCEVDFISDTKNGSIMKPRRLSEESGTVNHRLTDDLWLLFNDSKYSDAVITARDKQFHVHKLILQIRSPVFAKMLPNTTKENHYDEILIDDIKPEVVQKMLHFMYTNKIDNFEGMVKELLMAADRYDLDPLKALCVNYLCEKVTIENAADSLILGEQYKSEVLMKYCAKFIKCQLPKVIETPGYKYIEEHYPELAYYLIRSFALQMIQC